MLKKEIWAIQPLNLDLKKLRTIICALSKVPSLFDNALPSLEPIIITFLLFSGI